MDFTADSCKDRIRESEKFLFHFGWEMGACMAKIAIKREASPENLIRHGLRMHLSTGHITGISYQ